MTYRPGRSRYHHTRLGSFAPREHADVNGYIHYSAARVERCRRAIEAGEDPTPYGHPADVATARAEVALSEWQARS